ncbi:MAG: LysR family transcriptional regulator, partial [Clostridia bacterium]|nr:LysR family transcriptional regulator [Clostridia bacterium]
MENKIDTYKIFESVARNESISKASEELFISQPAVSQSIKRLEESLGGELFNRTKFGVSLTSEGKIFYDHIRKGLDHIENAERIFTSLKNIEVGSIKIGASASITKHILMPYLKEFRKNFPNINIDIVNHLSSNLVDMLKNGLLDLVILNLPMQNSADLEVYPFAEVQDIFCASPDYMDTEKEYSLEDLKKYKFITQKRPSNTRAFLDEFLKDNHVKTNPEIEAVSFNVVCDLTKIGFGYSYLTKEFIKDELDK